MRIIKKIYHGICFCFMIGLLFLVTPLAFIILGNKKYWLISEVDFDARDNGIHFFKYLNEEHPNIKSAYLISKKNPSYSFVKNIGKVIEPHSFKHLLFFIAAKAKISTLVHGCSPSYYVTKYLLKHHFTGKNIALKHGIFKNLHPNYFKKNAHLDLICCGAKPEYEFINSEFGYDNNVAKYTGLARFDELHNLDIKKEIFIMPTWRRWLDSIKDSTDFENTVYFKKWMSFLNDDLFLNMAKDHNLKICFYVHPKLNKYIDSFAVLKGKVSFLNSKNGDSVQLHLKEASVLITDFSSVFFDFAYMRKPAIYYQFDEKDYYDQHYIKAYFDYRDNGFGPVAVNEKELVKEIIDLASNDFRIKNIYLKRSEEFFPLHDNKNCERIFNSINEVIAK